MKEKTIIEREINRRCVWISNNLQYLEDQKKKEVESQLNTELCKLLSILGDAVSLRKIELLTEMEMTKQKLDKLAEHIQDHIVVKERIGDTDEIRIFRQFNDAERPYKKSRPRIHI